jgi:hypothetical protein
VTSRAHRRDVDPARAEKWGWSRRRIRPRALAELTLVEPELTWTRRRRAPDQEPQLTVPPRAPHGSRPDDARGRNVCTTCWEGRRERTDPPRSARARRRNPVPGRRLGGAGHGRRRGRVHDRDDRVRGGADGSLVLRAAGDDDGAPRRQHWHQRRGLREPRGPPAGRGLHRPATEPRRLELARTEALDAYLVGHGIVAIPRDRHADGSPATCATAAPKRMHRERRSGHPGGSSPRGPGHVGLDLARA